jgi:cell growth-regulating nucleolar protein
LIPFFKSRENGKIHNFHSILTRDTRVRVDDGEILIIRQLLQMVSFYCEQCCDTLKKPKLLQHLSRCKSAQFTCIDCSTTFQGNEFQNHTSCISEAEKYQKHLYIKKNVANQPRNSIISQLNVREDNPIKKDKPKDDDPTHKEEKDKPTQKDNPIDTKDKPTQKDKNIKSQKETRKEEKSIKKKAMKIIKKSKEPLTLKDFENKLMKKGISLAENVEFTIENNQIICLFH